MKASIIIFLIFVSILTVKSWPWGKTTTQATTATPCCTKDSPDCCCIQSVDGKEINFKKSGKVNSLNRLSCHPFKSCGGNGYIC